MNNPTRGRGRGRGFGANATQSASRGPTMVPISLAKQEKPLHEKLRSRFRDLSPDAVRVTQFKSGTVLEEILLNQRWITAVEAEPLLAQFQARQRVRIAVNRSLVRLGRPITEDQFEDLPQKERDILMMSQKEFNSFRIPPTQSGGLSA
jgi:hypothetical protein